MIRKKLNKVFWRKLLEDLNEDNFLKDKYIIKLKNEHKLFLDEAMKREDDMNELLQKQDKTIKKLKEIISDLRKTVELKKQSNKKSAGTQTVNTSKNVSVGTNLSVSNAKFIVQSNVKKTENYTKEDLAKLNKSSTDETLLRHVNPTATRRQILILSDEHGQGPKL